VVVRGTYTRLRLSMNTMRTLEELETNTYEATNNENDSELKQCITELESLTSPKAEALIVYAKASIELVERRYAESTELYLQALSMFAKVNNTRGMAYSNNGVSVCKFILSNYPQALEYFEVALELYEELGDKHGIAAVTGNIGNVYLSMGNYPQALEYYEQTLPLYERLGDKRGEVKIAGNIGIVHGQTGNYPQALEYFERALALCKELGMKSTIANVTASVGNVYGRTGNYPQALEHYERALDLCQELDMKSSIAHVIGTIGFVYSSIGSYPKALEYYERALEMHEEWGVSREIARDLGSIAEIQLAMGNYEAALSSAQRALSISKELGISNSTSRFVSIVTHAYVEAGDVEQAEETIATLKDTVIAEPDVAVRVEHARYAVRICKGDNVGAAESLRRALEIAQKHGLKPEEADTQKLLRDLAQENNDLAAYIEHNNEYTRLTEEINGKETAAKLAIQAKEQEMRAEREERERERAILYSTLPRSVADRMVQGQKVSGDEYHEAAVLFADITGFTRHSSNLSATQVTEFLASIFTAFDKLCEQHSVTKVKTIGDSYMCFKGDGEAEENADAIAKVALGITDASFTWPSPDRAENSIPDSVQLRVGIAIGPATAGVIGTDRLQYDVWGDTVNVASRMESTGEPGRIQVHETIVEVLAKAPYTFISRGDVEVKGKGAVPTWWLEVGD